MSLFKGNNHKILSSSYPPSLLLLKKEHQFWDFIFQVENGANKRTSTEKKTSEHVPKKSVEHRSIIININCDFTLSPYQIL